MAWQLDWPRNTCHGWCSSLLHGALPERSAHFSQQPQEAGVIAPHAAAKEAGVPGSGGPSLVYKEPSLSTCRLCSDHLCFLWWAHWSGPGVPPGLHGLNAGSAGGVYGPCSGAGGCGSRRAPAPSCLPPGLPAGLAARVFWLGLFPSLPAPHSPTGLL